MRASRSIVMIAVMAFAIPTPAMADMKVGVAAWNSRDFAGAIREFRLDAEAGNPDALYNLGIAYRDGLGVSRDLPLAESYFRRARSIGHGAATTALAHLLYERQAHAEAIPLLEISAAQADMRSYFLLGIAYWNGTGVQRDIQRSRAFLLRARDGGHSPAEDALRQIAQIEAAAPKGAPPKQTTAEPAFQVRNDRWPVSLGAFAVSGNAERALAAVRGDKAFAGLHLGIVRKGRLDVLTVTGFSTRANAINFCRRFSSAGRSCILL